MQMLQHLTGPYRSRQETAGLMEAAVWTCHKSRQAFIAEAQQYMWTRSGQISQKPQSRANLFAMPRRSTAEFTDSVMNTAAYSWHGDARCFHRGRIRNSLKRPVHSTGIPSCLCLYSYGQRQDNANGNISRRILFHFPAKVWHESEEKLCGIEIPGLPGGTMSAF